MYFALPPGLPTPLFCVVRGTVEDTELVEGLVLEQKASHFAGGITRVEKAKIGLIQFCISPPKTDVSSWIEMMIASLLEWLVYIVLVY